MAAKEQKAEKDSREAAPEERENYREEKDAGPFRRK